MLNCCQVGVAEPGWVVPKDDEGGGGLVLLRAASGHEPPGARCYSPCFGLCRALCGRADEGCRSKVLARDAGVR